MSGFVVTVCVCHLTGGHRCPAHGPIGDTSKHIRTPTSLLTRYGWFDPMNPAVADVDVRDLAWHLARKCRWSGATRSHVSIAQHAVMVAMLVEQWIDGKDPLLPYAALHHDDEEFILPDISSPLKPMFPELTAQGVRVRRVIQTALDIPHGAEDCPTIRRADKLCLAIEARDELGDRWRPTYQAMCPRDPYDPWGFELSMSRYVEYHNRLAVLAGVPSGVVHS